MYGAANRATLPGITTAGKAHHLCDALTIVLGSLEQLRCRPLGEREREQLDRAEWGARHAGRLAREIFALGHGKDAGAERVDLNEAVRAFAATVGQEVGGAGVAFAVELAPGPLLARLHREELELALLNLVRNAAGATAGGGQITLRTAGHWVGSPGAQPSTVEVAVSATGTGTAPEAAQQAGEALFASKGPKLGTRLGLWMVRRLAADAGGTVEIEAGPRQGTTITVILPRAEPG